MINDPMLAWAQRWRERISSAENAAAAQAEYLNAMAEFAELILPANTSGVNPALMAVAHAAERAGVPREVVDSDERMSLAFGQERARFRDFRKNNDQ